ncbi:MAG: NAD(P)-binding domain-containing protein, partial [Pelolinea sp.]|nr:NAD(P)-binding domain-containing protein [Pelolinea sp.]
MLSEITIAFVGPGVMAEAMLLGLLKKNLIPAEKILISGPIVDQNEYLQKIYGVNPFTDNTLAVKNADVVILSVKP